MNKKQNLIRVGLGLGVILILLLLFWGRGFIAPLDLNRGPYGDLNKALKDTDSLLKLTNTQAQEEVVQAVIQSGDLAKCEVVKGLTLDGYDYYTVCKNNISLNSALKDKNPALCQGLDDKLVTVKDCEGQVMLVLVQGAKDVTVCQSFTNPDLHKDCEEKVQLELAVLSGDLKKCDSLGTAPKVECRLRIWVGQTIANPSTGCGPVKDIMQSSECTRFVQMAKAGITSAAQCGRFLPVIQTACLETLHK